MHLKQSLILFLVILALMEAVLTPKVGFTRLNDTVSNESEATSFKIQKAINDANVGDVIVVPSGVYYEHVLVNKTVSLFGGEDLTTVIDGTNNGTVIEIAADNVTIAFFKLQNSGYGWMNHGVHVYNASDCKIENNWIYYACHNIKLNCSRNCLVQGNTINGTIAPSGPTAYGIRVDDSVNCTVLRNNVSDCIGAVHLGNASNCVVNNNILCGNSQGIRMYSPGMNNTFFENVVENNTYDGMIDNSFGGVFFNNSLFHNNFINNTNQFIYNVYNASSFSWDDNYPSGGNHWSRYNGTDTLKGIYQNETGQDGIGDVNYEISYYGKDRYPLMHPYGSIRNLNTSLTYLTINSAIDSDETRNGHALSVKNGNYREHLTINKTIALIGENQTSTLIDGEGTGTVVTINADNVTIAGFTVRNGGLLFPPYGNDCGILLNHCGGISIGHDLVVDNRIGIYLYYSENNVIEYNVVQSNREDGLLLWYSGNNTLTHNTLVNNTRNFGVFGDSYLNFDNSVDQSNTVNGKPIYYLVGASDALIENRTDVGVLYLVNCTNVTVRNMEFTNNAQGVFCFNVSNSKIENVTSSRNSYGVNLQNSAKNLVLRNRCTDNWVGVLLQDSSDNSVCGNTVVGGEKGISLYEADNDTVKENTIVNATFGIRLYASSLNMMFHNNFIENAEQASVLSGSYQNSWDDGVEGNFWSEYVGQDSNRDGLGDDFYNIDSQNQDNHPLLGDFHAFEVSYNGTTYQINVIANSTVLAFAYEESFNTIRLTVNGSEATFGFCRIRVPHALVEPELNVIIDDGFTQVLHANCTLFDDGFHRWIFFAYSHSTHVIVVIHELQFLILWLVFASLPLLILAKARKQHQMLK